MVVTSRLQSGAEKVARNGAIGIVKFDEHGLEIVAERRGRLVENGFLRAQMFRNVNTTKSLKFSGFYDGAYFLGINDFVNSMCTDAAVISRRDLKKKDQVVPFLSLDQIKFNAKTILESIGYTHGAVDLRAICEILFIDLQFSDREVIDIDGTSILGSAIFGRKKMIVINSHSLETRERFTLAHEIGHFVLDHERYLRSETVVERDLFITKENSQSFNYERLEYQANAFAAELLLPDAPFLQQTANLRRALGMKDRGHGYIFVDDQPHNISDYNEFLSRLSNYFQVSKQAVEVKLRKSRMLTDQRKRNETSQIANILSGVASLYKN